jgi:hypothetical protein
MLFLERRAVSSLEILPLLRIVSGGELAQPTSEKIINDLKTVNVELIVQRPLLALPSTHD